MPKPFVFFSKTCLRENVKLYLMAFLVFLSSIENTLGLIGVPIGETSLELEEKLAF